MVRSGADHTQEVPPGRWILPPEIANGGADPKTDRVRAVRGAFVTHPENGLRSGDLSQELLKSLDPSVQLAVHAGIEAVGNSPVRLDPDRTHVILGQLLLPTESTSSMADAIIGDTLEETVLGEINFDDRRPRGYPTCHPLDRHDASLPATALRSALGLRSGAWTLDAACASALYAVSKACDDLISNRCDHALAGGVSRPDALFTQMGFSQLRALSPEGRCRPLDDRGQGLVVGEGAGILRLRRLKDAEENGEPILGVIRGWGLSNDRSGGLLAPSGEGQVRAMRRAYQQAGWSPSEVDFIECHATGTPVGDGTELNSLQELWSDQNWNTGQCALGSIKASIGHTLTAAGSAGLIKVILAMKNGEIPPLPDQRQTPGGFPLESSPFRIPDAAEPWLQQTGRSRRSAVSAFGFGGINAHLLIEEYSPSRVEVVKTAPTTRYSDSPIAVVGFGAMAGPIKNCSALRSTLLTIDEFSHDQSPLPGQFGIPESRWLEEEGLKLSSGAPSGPLKSSPVNYRIPPTEMRDLLPQQLALLQVCREALQHADMDELGLGGSVLVGLNLDPRSSLFHLRWILPERGRSWLKELGIEARPEEVDQWINKLQDEVSDPLTANRVMGALGSVAASRIARDLGAGGPSHTVSNDDLGGFRAIEQGIHSLQDRSTDAVIVAAADFGLDVISRVNDARQGLPPRTDAAAALILRRLEDAEKDQQNIYGILEGTGCAAADSLFSGSRTLPAERATQLAMWQNSRPHIVLSPTDHPINLSKATRTPGTRIVSLPTELENSGCVTPILSTIQGLMMFDAAVLPSSSMDRPAIPWLHALTGKATTRIDFRGRLGDHGSLLMRMAQPKLADNKISINGDLPWGHVLLEGNSSVKSLSDFEYWLQHLSNEELSASRLTKLWLAKQPSDYSSSKAIGILFRDYSSLCEALAETKNVPEEEKRDLRGEGWEVLRSHPTALGFAGDVGFVYPGSGSLYSGAGQQLLTRFSGAMTSTRDDGGMLHRMISDPAFWSPMTPLPGDVREEILAQVALGGFGTDLLRGFGIEPVVSCGHSLGQTAMLFAQGVWQQRREMQNQMETGDLFDVWLGGEFRAARSAWNLKSMQETPWAACVVDRSRTEVERALRRYQRCFLLLVNASDEVVIGGDPTEIKLLTETEGWSSVPLSGVTSVHCPLVELVREEYRSLHDWPVTAPKNGSKILCTASAKPLSINSADIANSILNQAIHGFDFPQLIEEMWNQGTRIFIEPGPGASCSRLIRKALGDKNYRTLPLFWRGESEELSLTRLLLACAVERIPVNFEPLLGNDSFAVIRTLGDDENLVEIPDGKGPRHVPALPASMKRNLKSPALPTEIATEVVPVTEREQRLTTNPSEEPNKILEPAISAVTSPVPSPVPPSPVPSPSSAPSSAQSKVLPDMRKARLEERLRRVVSRRIESSESAATEQTADPDIDQLKNLQSTPERMNETSKADSGALFNRAQCLEFARGSVGPVLGMKHGEADLFPTRVRLPDEPLMLVDRILSMEGEPLTLGSGRIVTAHDVKMGSWYLDSGRIPTSIAVESGQADLFLSGFLGADLHTRGESVYRLLDAQITFHSDLPTAGKSIIYDIRINEFFRQDKTLLFRFEFDATVDGEPFLMMRDGCAGFFSPEELASGRGIVQSPHRPRPQPKCPADWSPPTSTNRSDLDSTALNLLRQGELGQVFGPAFKGINLKTPWTLPGGLMTLIDRITRIEAKGGDYGLGHVVGELKIHPDDWFLTCHFTDDHVMPGTLMYESCIHTLRVLLMSWGWVGEAEEISAMPVPGIAGRLRCRGQVTPETRLVSYEVHVHEIGLQPNPYVIASAVMLADGKPIVEMEGLSLRLVGLSEEALTNLWRSNHPVSPTAADTDILPTAPGGGGDHPLTSSTKPTIYSHDQILSFATGLPSAAFGDRYEIFDGDRYLARLPGPPYCFLDRIVDVKGEPWVVKAGAECTAEYMVPPDAWYFAAGGSGEMPFAILLEIALQPCGWLAGYVGSALTSPDPLHFRNLGGEATLQRPITAESGLLTTRVKMTAADHGAGMWIQHFDLEVDDSKGPLYRGKTYFGFFPPEALAEQVGLPGAVPKTVSPRESMRGKYYPLDQRQPGPTKAFRMLDEVDLYIPDGGSSGLGFIRGSINVNPNAWFFKAHFMGDPVWPGSLGLESMLQLLQEIAVDRWGPNGSLTHRSILPGVPHRWTYRGQVIPSRKRVVVEAQVNEIDDEKGFLRADGMLIVDDLPIYSMEDFTIQRRNSR